MQWKGMYALNMQQTDLNLFLDSLFDQIAKSHILQTIGSKMQNKHFHFRDDNQAPLIQ